MSERIKIENMTLGQIRDIKLTLANNISEAISQLVNAFNNKFDCGDVGVEVDTDVDIVYNEIGGVYLKSIKYDTSVKFSKEDI